MIIVNLLPHHLRPIKRTPLPHMLSILVLAGVIAIVAVMFVQGMTTMSSKNAQLDKVTSDLTALDDIVAAENVLSRQKESLQSRISVIEQILQDRTIWSEQLNRLAHLTPDNIWYSSISITQKQHTEYQNRPVKGKPNETTRVAVRKPRPVLQVSGYAINDEFGIRSIAPLTERTTNDPDFSKKFELISSPFSDTLFGIYPVRSFTMEYWIKTTISAEETP